MTSTINSFLEKHRATTDCFSHISMIYPKGRFFFDRNTHNEFFNIYCENYKKDDFKVGVGEKPDNYIPILVDIDLKGHDQKSLYNKDMVEKTVQVYQEVIKDIVKDVSDVDLLCVFLEKDGYTTKDGVYKNGFHLHFPYIFLSEHDHTKFLLPRVKTKLVDVYKEYKIDDVVDKGYVKAPWLLLGSIKDAAMKSYRVSSLYDSNCKQTNIDSLLNYEIFDENQNRIELSKDNIEFNMPRILSIKIWGRRYDRQVVDDIEVVRSVQKKKKKKVVRGRVINNQNDMKLCEKLLKVLSVNRADNHNEWIYVGFVVYNISNGSSKGLKMWKEFSKKITQTHKTRGSPGNFNEETCDKEWDRMLVSDLSIGTLKYIAKKDNEKLYNNIMKGEMEQHLSKSVDIGGSHFDIANALYEKYGSEIICSSIRHKEWMEFSNHAWRKTEEGTILRKKISTEIVRILDNNIKVLMKEISRLDDLVIVKRDYSESESDSDSDSDTEIDIRENQKKYNDNMKDKGKLEEKIKILFRIMGQCKNAQYKNNVMRECMELFYNEDFNKKINSNRYLIGLQNGVYDLKKDLFREGLPEDYISLQMNVDYKKFSRHDYEYVEVQDYLSKVFPDKEILKYFMDISSDIFVGGNPNKLVSVWSGDGDNAKSITEMIFVEMLGSYSVKLPTTLLTGKKTSAGSACPELARAGNGVRWALAQEPEKSEVINTGILKELSGNDKVFVRALYKDGCDMEPMFKLALVCNDKPRLSSNEKAVWNRIRVLPFESTFSVNAPETIEEQQKEKVFPVDTFFKDKIPKLVTAFAYILFEHRRQHKKDKRFEPIKVTKATEAYQRKNDIYRQFKDESLIEDKTKYISLYDIYANFKDWFKQNYPNQTIPIKNDVKEYFEKMWGEINKSRKWKGYRMRTIQDDLEDGEAFCIYNEDDQANPTFLS
jgi:P4 family phage/plasmid primase-like protien